MPSFKFDSLLEVKINSKPSTLPGEEHRSSDNYNLIGITNCQLKWTCPEGIIFDVMEDRTAASDPITFPNVKNGTITPALNDSSANGLYIANPQHAADTFEISIVPYQS